MGFKPIIEQKKEAPIPEGGEGTFTERIGGGTPEQRTVFGLPRNTESLVFPRAAQVRADEGQIAEGKPMVRAGLGSALDLVSIPGRTIASAPALLPGGESFSEAFSRPQGKQREGIGGKALEIGGSIVRDPVTALGTLATGGANLLATPARTLFARGAVAGLPLVGAQQTKRFAEEGKVSPSEAALETGINALLPVIGQQLQRGAKAVFRSGIKPKMKARDLGFDPEAIINHKIEGSFENIVKKSSARIDEAKRVADDIIEQAAKTNPEAKFDIESTIIQFMDDAENGKVSSILIGDEKNALKIADDFFNSLKKRNLIDEDGLSSISQFQQIKRELGKRGFQKSRLVSDETALKAKVADLLYFDVMNEIENVVPEIAAPNKMMADLIPVRSAVIDAISRTGNRNAVLNASNLMMLHGLASPTAMITGGNLPKTAGTVLSGLGANILLRQGRGGALLSKAGRSLGGGTARSLGGRTIEPDTPQQLIQGAKGLQELFR